MAQPTYYALFLWKRVAAGRVIAGTKSRTRQRWRLAWRNKSPLLLSRPTPALRALPLPKEGC